MAKPKAPTRVLTTPGKGAKASSYAAIPGDPARAYQHKRTGAIISRRQFQKLQRGGISNEQYAFERRMAKEPNKMATHNGLVAHYKGKKARELGVPESMIRVRGPYDTASEFHELLQELRGWRIEEGEIDKKRNKLLAKLGLIAPQQVSVYAAKKSH